MACPCEDDNGPDGVAVYVAIYVARFSNIFQFFLTTLDLNINIF
jgi:hypothetical protein